MWLSNSLVVSAHAVSLREPDGFNDTLSINLAFENGSIGTICYFANGSSRVPKEYIEVYSAGLTGVIRDFREHEVFHDGGSHRRKTIHQDKGQSHMIRQFLDRLKAGGGPILNPTESLVVMQACFAVEESLRTQNVVFLRSGVFPERTASHDRSEETDAASVPAARVSAPAVAEPVPECKSPC
jgi:polar amino acid transport system substrate-binding protein